MASVCNLLFPFNYPPHSSGFLLQFSQMKADGEVRWAVLNVATILRKYEALQVRIAKAMEEGKSVGSIVKMIDEQVSDDLIGV
jgi:hypothetical protein